MLCCHRLAVQGELAGRWGKIRVSHCMGSEEHQRLIACCYPRTMFIVLRNDDKEGGRKE